MGTTASAASAAAANSGIAAATESSMAVRASPLVGATCTACALHAPESSSVPFRLMSRFHMRSRSSTQYERRHSRVAGSSNSSHPSLCTRAAPAAVAAPPASAARTFDTHACSSSSLSAAKCSGRSPGRGVSAHTSRASSTASASTAAHMSHTW